MTRYTLFIVALASINPLAPDLLAQGSLAPPGAPGATMKTLAQIEPRTPISSAPFTITQSGSYYLTQNLTVASGNAIFIDAGNNSINGVTIDLNGFTISSTASSASGAAIHSSSFFGVRNLHILNGNIAGGVNADGTFSGTGFQNGIDTNGPDSIGSRVSNVSVTGCAGDGIYLGQGNTSTVVDNCEVRGVGGRGIVAVTVFNSTASLCGQSAIIATSAENCRADTSGSSDALQAFSAVNCYGISVSGKGVNVTNALSCYGKSTSGTGLLATASAENCTGSGATGINAQLASNCYGTGTGSGATGINAQMASNCYGTGTGSAATGISAEVASNCYGTGTAVGIGGHGSVANCFAVATGNSGIGIDATSVMNSVGQCLVAGTGIRASRTFACGGVAQTGPGLDVGLAFLSAGTGASIQYFCGSGGPVYP